MPSADSNSNSEKKLFGSVAVVMFVVAAAALLVFRGAPPRTTTFRVGAILPLSGDAAESGAASRLGFLLAAADIAAASTRYPVVAVSFADSALSGEQGRVAAEELADDADVLFSSFSAVTKDVSPVALAAGKTLFYDSCNCGFAAENPLAFQIYFDPRKECRAAAEYYKRGGASRIAFVGQDVPYGRYCYEALQDVFGADNVLIETEAADIRRNYGALLLSLQSQGAGAVVSVPAVNDFVSFFRANNESGANLPVACATAACLSKNIRASAEPEWLQDVVGFGIRVNGSFAARVAKLRPEFSPEQILSAAIAYDTAWYAAEAYRQCERDDDACLTRAKEQTTLRDPAIAASGFGEDHILDYESEYIRYSNAILVPFSLAP